MPLAQGASAPDPRLTLAMLPVADMQAVAPSQYGAASGLAADGAGPLEIALAVAGPFEGSTQHVIVLNEGGESAVSAHVTVLRDGLLDDAVRGERWDVTVRRIGSGKWRVEEVRRAWRCYRGAHTDRFAGARCP